MFYRTSHMFGEPVENFWKLNTRMLIKYHTGDSAEMGAYFGGPVLEISTLIALKLYPEKIFFSDHNNNLKWTIFPEIFLFQYILTIRQYHDKTTVRRRRHSTVLHLCTELSVK